MPAGVNLHLPLCHFPEPVLANDGPGMMWHWNECLAVPRDDARFSARSLPSVLLMLAGMALPYAE